MAVIGTEPHEYGSGADEVRSAEGRDVAHVITTVLAEGWEVQDKAAGADARRPCRLGDITILVPARTSLPFLEDALEAARIPYRAESSSLVYATRAVRDLLMVLRAADDPTDHLRIVSALRTPLLGCGDDDLFRHKVIDGRTWSYNTPTPPDPADGIVSAGLAFLRDLHENRYWHSPAELLDRIARDRRALELGFAEGRPRDVWRRLRFVIDQARAWSEATGGSLRAYLHWVDQQTAEGSRVAESVLPETDDDAVRIMTIHAAKGLEFPITIVSGLSARPGGMRSPVEVHFPRDGGPVGYRMGKEVVTAGVRGGRARSTSRWATTSASACSTWPAPGRATTSCVSLHRVERKNPPAKNSSRTNAEILVAGMGDRLDDLPDLGGEPVALPVDPAAVPPPPPPFDEWEAERAAALAVASRPGAVAATALTDEGAPDWGTDASRHPTGPAARGPPCSPACSTTPPTAGADARRDPWVGEDGDPGPLEPDVDPGSAEAPARPRPAAVAEGPLRHRGRPGRPRRAADDRPRHRGRARRRGRRPVPGRGRARAGRRRPPPRAGTRSARPSCRRPPPSPHWREVYACTPIGDRLLEGYVDLLYRGADGLVVVDHKTSGSADPDELDRRVEGYRLQGAAYALAVGRATAEPVTRVVFLFLTPARRRRARARRPRRARWPTSSASCRRRGARHPVTFMLASASLWRRVPNTSSARHLMALAFDDFSDDDWQRAVGGRHVV